MHSMRSKASTIKKLWAFATRKELKEGLLMDKPVLIDNGTVIKPARKGHVYSMDFGMAFVTPKNEQVASFASCRDYMHDQIRTFLNDKTRVKGDGHPYYPETGDPDIFMPRLRLLIRCGSKGYDKLLYALHVLNTIETYAGMELTIAEKVSMSGVTGSLILLRGSGEYMSNPHLLSMVTLIMRFCTYNPAFKVTDHLSLAKGYDKIKSKIVKDSHLMCHCYKLLHHVLKDRDRLFDGLTLKQLFPTNINYGFHGKGGVQQLCCSLTNNDGPNEKIRKMKKKYKIKN